MMKKILLPAAILLLTACNNDRSFRKAEDASDAGREFIRASLDGNYEKASFYLYPDTTNKNIFGKWKAMHERMNPDEQQKYKDASILPIDIHPVNDSVTSYTFANSYKKDTSTFLIVRVNGEWLVDLKEILNGHHH
ncbi:MAG TPA: hypothetical protein VGM89_14970 [Puia sp.]|jgi:hypothetical protein